MRLKYSWILLACMLLISKTILAANTPISLTIINNTRLNVIAEVGTKVDRNSESHGFTEYELNANHPDLEKTAAVAAARENRRAMQFSDNADNINMKNLQTLENQKLHAGSQYKFLIQTTGPQANLLVNFRVTTPGNQNGDIVGQWQYMEIRNRAETCHHVMGNPPYQIRCIGNDNINKPAVILTLSDGNQRPSASTTAANQGPVTLTFQNNTSHDIEFNHVSSKNIHNQDIQDLETHKVYSNKSYTMSFTRTGYPARIHLNIVSSETAGEHRNVSVGQWEYVEVDETSKSCNNIAANFPYKIRCNGTGDITSKFSANYSDYSK